VEKITENAAEFPWAERNFLKKPFLQACEAIGLIKQESAPGSIPHLLAHRLPRVARRAIA